MEKKPINFYCQWAHLTWKEIARERIIFCASNQFPQNYSVWNEFYLSQLTVLELIKVDMNSMKGQKDWTLQDELPRLVGAQYNSRKNEEMEP